MNTTNMKIDVDKVLPNPDQPRTIFDEDELQGLANSIKENSLIQPIVVERADTHYVLVDGERRWRAHKLLGWETIDAVVREATNHNGRERLTHALVANVQRSSMGFVDEAKAYEKLLKDLGTLDAVAEKVGVSATTISGRLSLLELHETAQKFFNLKKIPYDLSVLAIMKRLEPEDQARVASMAATRGWKTESILRSARRILELKGKPYKRITRTKPQEPEVKGRFDALALVQGKKIPAPLKKTAQKTCQTCALYEEASVAICRECPLPQFLNLLPVDVGQ